MAPYPKAWLFFKKMDAASSKTASKEKALEFPPLFDYIKTILEPVTHADFYPGAKAKGGVGGHVDIAG